MHLLKSEAMFSKASEVHKSWNISFIFMYGRSAKFMNISPDSYINHLNTS